MSLANMIDDTLIAAFTSTKDKDVIRNAEIHQTKKIQ